MEPKSTANHVALGESYAKRAEVSAGLPVYMIIESTSICNLECVMCPYKDMTRQKVHMDMGLFRRIVDEAKDFVEFAWLHLFGEPLLNGRIYEMIDYAEAAGIRTGLSTNGTPLTAAAAEGLLESRLSLLLVSLDGASKEVYEYVRAGAKFEQVEANVARFAELRRASSNTRLKAVLSIINMKPNRDEVAPFVRRWEGRGFDNVIVKPFHFWAGQDDEILALDPDGGAKRSEGLCYEPWAGFAVQANGHVVPCCNDYDGRMVLGDARVQPLAEIWNGEPMRALRRMLGGSGAVPGTICHKCPFPCATAEQAHTGGGPFDPVSSQIGFYAGAGR